MEIEQKPSAEQEFENPALPPTSEDFAELQVPHAVRMSDPSKVGEMPPSVINGQTRDKLDKALLDLMGTDPKTYDSVIKEIRTREGRRNKVDKVVYVLGRLVVGYTQIVTAPTSRLASRLGIDFPSKGNDALIEYVNKDRAMVHMHTPGYRTRQALYWLKDKIKR
jgi:hypothetical protein